MKADSGRTKSRRSKEVFIALLLILGLATTLYCVLFSDSSVDKDKLTVEVLQERHTSGDQPVAESEDPSPGAEEEVVNPKEESDEEKVASDPEDQSTSPPINQKKFLVVHSFGVRSNASKFASKLEGHGYEVKSAVRSNGWTAVGVLFDPTAVDEEGILDALSVEYQAKPVLWEELESTK